MDKVYNHKIVEEKVYKNWEKRGYFKPEINCSGKPYCIILPPPNANGALHFGQAMYVIEDILIRYHRMLGDSSLWFPGADHAGFETQFVFEKKLKEKGKSRFDYDQKTLYKMIWDYVQENRKEMENQLRRLGFSLDWTRSKFTLEEDIIKIVYQTFKKMYDDGLVYRGDRLVNYCTRCGTSFSDLEVNHKEQKDPLYYIKYGPFVLATVRPETKFGDTAVAVNPKDKRYKEWIGKEIEVQGVIGKFRVGVVADEMIDPNFGTGVAKVTPAHDMKDFEIGLRHNLKRVQVIDLDGKLNEKTGKYKGLYIKQARKLITEDMGKMGLIEKIDENYTHIIEVCYKCGTTIEPMLLPQWFIKMEPLAKPAIDAVKKGKIKIFPKRFEKVYSQFLENIRDWNISRQIVWGIRIPAYKCRKDESGKLKIENENKKTLNSQLSTLNSEGKWFVSVEKPDKCNICGKCDFEQDSDTFDTWFSSAQWPFATLMPSIMGFHEDIVPQVLKGKTKTYRLRDYGFKEGDKVLFENTQAQKPFGYGVIKAVEETTIEKIDYKDKTHFKTYESLEDLIEAFKLRNPDKTVTPKSKAYLYTYEFHSLKELGDFPNDFERFYPTSVMETGYDILRWWVARMVMVGLYVTKKVPFEHIVLHGLVNDPYGKKMSKSKGNVVNPLEVVDKYGADAVRFALIYGNATGNDQSLSYSKLDAARKFTNKLWNIARFITLCHPELDSGSKSLSTEMPKQVRHDIRRLLKMAKHKNDKEMVKKTEELVEEITRYLDDYQFNLAAERLYDFIWHEFADKYIENVKSQSFDKAQDRKSPPKADQPLAEKVKSLDDNSFIILNSLFLILLKLLHPFMPFVTEEIYQRFGFGESIMIDKWPA